MLESYLIALTFTISSIFSDIGGTKINKNLIVKELHWTILKNDDQIGEIKMGERLF